MCKYLEMEDFKQHKISKIFSLLDELDLTHALVERKKYEHNQTACRPQNEHGLILPSLAAFMFLAVMLLG